MKPTGQNDIYGEAGRTAGTEIRNLSVNMNHCGWVKLPLICNYQLHEQKRNELGFDIQFVYQESFP